jgi:sialidase-1
MKTYCLAVSTTTPYASLNMNALTTTYIKHCGADRPRSDTASIIEMADGTLLCAYHSYVPGPDDGGDFGKARIYLSESTDSGLSWENERMIFEAGEGDLNAMCPSLHVYGNRVLLLYLINHKQTVSSTFVAWSEDGGATFTTPTPIWNHIEEHRFCGYDGITALPDGRLLVPFQTSKEVWTKNEHITIGIIVSGDGGVTWDERDARISLPMRGAMEPSIAILEDDTLRMSMRSQLGSVFLSTSNDAGNSWSLPQTTGLKSPESCTTLARVPGTDRIVLFWNDSTYVPTHHHYGLRTPLSVAASDDGGISWQKLFDIETAEYTEYTNLSCFFTSKEEAILTYLESEGKPDGSFERSCMSLKAAIIPKMMLVS